MECLPLIDKIKEEAVDQEIKQEEESFELIEEESEVSDETKVESCQVEKDRLDAEREEIFKTPEFTFVKVEQCWDESEEQEQDSLIALPAEKIKLEPQFIEEERIATTDSESTSHHGVDIGKFDTDQNDWKKAKQKNATHNTQTSGKSTNIDFSFAPTDFIKVASILESADDALKKYCIMEQREAHARKTVEKDKFNVHHYSDVLYSKLEWSRELARARSRKFREKKRLHNIKSSQEKSTFVEENKDSKLERRRELARERINKKQPKKSCKRKVPTIAEVNEDSILERRRELARERSKRSIGMRKDLALILNTKELLVEKKIEKNIYH